MKYCPCCDQVVAPTKQFSWAWFLFWVIIGVGGGGLVYLGWYFLFTKKKCPKCLNKKLLKNRPMQFAHR